MADIIDLNGNAGRFRLTLEQKQREIDGLRDELQRTKNALASIVSINDLLKLQLSDLIATLNNMQNNFAQIATNLRNLQAQLPEIR